MSSKWHQKKERLAREQFERELQNTPDELQVKNQASAAAMGGGDDQIYAKKLSKEEKKALAKAKREAKKKAKNKKGGANEEENKAESALEMAQQALQTAQDGLKHRPELGVDNAAADALASEGTICTFATSRKGVDQRSRDINIQNFTLQHKGMVMLDQSEIVLNHGNRYGLIGRNGTYRNISLRQS